MLTDFSYNGQEGFFVGVQDMVGFVRSASKKFEQERVPVIQGKRLKAKKCKKQIKKNKNIII